MTYISLRYGIMDYNLGGLNVKMLSRQYRNSHWSYWTILWLSYLINGISFTGKMTSFSRDGGFGNWPVMYQDTLDKYELNINPTLIHQIRT